MNYNNSERLTATRTQHFIRWVCSFDCSLKNFYVN